MIKFNLNNNYFLILVITSLCLCLSSCGGGGGSSSEAGGNTSEKIKEQIRFLNVIPTESAVNVQLGEDIFIEELAYGDSTSFFEAPEGEKIELIITSAERVVPLLSASQTIAQGAKQTYLLFSDSGTISLKVYDEIGKAPLPEQFRIRFLNLSTEQASVDVYLTLPGEGISELTAAKSALAFNTVSDYISIPRGIYDIVYTQAGGSKILRRARSVSFENGRVYTHYLIDNINGRGQVSRLNEDPLF